MECSVAIARLDLWYEEGRLYPVSNRPFRYSLRTQDRAAITNYTHLLIRAAERVKWSLYAHPEREVQGVLLPEDGRSFGNPPTGADLRGRPLIQILRSKHASPSSPVPL